MRFIAFASLSFVDFFVCIFLSLRIYSLFIGNTMTLGRHYFPIIILQRHVCIKYQIRHTLYYFLFGCLKVKQAFLFFQIGHGIDVILYSLMENSFEFLTRFWCNVSYIHPNTNHTEMRRVFLYIKYTEKNGNKRMQYLWRNAYDHSRQGWPL